MKYIPFLKKITSETIRDLTSFGNPIVLLIVSIIFLGINIKIISIIIGLITVELFCIIIKYFLHRERPKKENYENTIERINAGSFPSLHSARSSFVFSSLLLISTVLSQKIFFLILILIVGITRILMKKHYISDVIAGYIIGIGFSLLFNYLKFF